MLLEHHLQHSKLLSKPFVEREDRKVKWLRLVRHVRLTLDNSELPIRVELARLKEFEETLFYPN